VVIGEAVMFGDLVVNRVAVVVIRKAVAVIGEAVAVIGEAKIEIGSEERFAVVCVSERMVFFFFNKMDFFINK